MSTKLCKGFCVKVGARNSLLSQKQIEEILQELRAFHPQVSFEPILTSTYGDLDLKTSLRTLGKTDFFTKEIDEMVLKGSCQVGIHSAKDLPDPLPQGLELIALTKGVDPSDSLVFREGESLETLPKGAKVGSSAERRDQTVRSLRPDLVCTDIRGTIISRLEQLDAGKYDAVVIAEAALIRLGLTGRSRLRLPGETAPLQGRLAVIARAADVEMQQLFACIDAR